MAGLDFRKRGALIPAGRGPGCVLLLMVALTCLSAGFFLGNSSQLAERSVVAAAATGSAAGASSTGSAAEQQGSSSDGNSSTGGASAHAGKEKSVCDNSCPTAGDGTCDDGRVHRVGGEHAADSLSIFPVKCDLGTDCDDCGPWVSACRTLHCFWSCCRCCRRARAGSRCGAVVWVAGSCRRVPVRRVPLGGPKLRE